MYAFLNLVTYLTTAGLPQLVDQQWSRLEGCKRTETEGSAAGKRLDLRASWMTTLNTTDFKIKLIFLSVYLLGGFIYFK